MKKWAERPVWFRTFVVLPLLVITGYMMSKGHQMIGLLLGVIAVGLAVSELQDNSRRRIEDDEE